MVAADDDSVALGRTVGVGCFSLFVGTWSGAMVAVLLGKMIEGLRKSPSCEGLPICNWYVYAGIGAMVGAISLPILVLRRLKRRQARETNARG
jgi:hypothetical protein